MELTEEMLIKAFKKMKENTWRRGSLILHPRQYEECVKRGWIKDGQLDWKKIAEDTNGS